MYIGCNRISGKYYREWLQHIETRKKVYINICPI